MYKKNIGGLINALALVIYKFFCKTGIYRHQTFPFFLTDIR